MVQELKTFTSERIYWAVEQVEREAGDIDNLHLDDNSFYLKSEADKVISGLEKKIKFLQVTAICKDCNKCADGMGKVFDETLNELKAQKAQAEDDCAYWKTKAQRERHQKYKRCLAMAKICENKLGTVVKPGWWDKWRKRWLELAEKFEEAR